MFDRPSPVSLSAALPPVTFSMFLIVSSLTPPTFTVALLAPFSVTTTEVTFPVVGGVDARAAEESSSCRRRR